MVNAPKISLEQAPAVLRADFIEAAVNGDTGVVNPSVNPPEPFYGRLSEPLHLAAIRHIASDGERLTAGVIYLAGNAGNGFLAARGENDFGAAFGSQFSCGQPNAA